MIKYFLLFIPFYVSSQTHIDKTDKEKHAFSVHMESEGRISKNQISRNQKEWHPYIPYTEMGLLYSKDNNLKIFINGEMESYKNTWQIGLDEFSLSYDFEVIPFHVKAGWLPLPIGYRDENNHLFSQDLSCYNILAWSQEDMGAIADLYIWKKFLSLSASYFGGWLYREQDDSYRAPESAPFIISMKSQGFFWDAFASWFEKNLAFFDPLKAYGGGFHLHTSYKKLTVSLQSEFWEIKEKAQTTFTYYVFPNITIDKLKVGMVFGNINRFSPNFKTTQAKSSLYERVFQVSYQIHPNVTLIGERFISSQIKGYLTNDLWSARVKVHFDWPLQKHKKPVF